MNGVGNRSSDNTAGAGAPRSKRVALQRLLSAALAGLVLALLPLAGGEARGIIWLKTQQATGNSGPYLHPVMATYRNHAYILSVRETSQTTSSVYLTTNRSGSWKTSLVSNRGPTAGSYSQEFVALAVDPQSKRLYAAWIYGKTKQTVAIGVWSGDLSGNLSTGPTEVFSAGTLPGQPTLAAGAGKVYLAFTATPGSAPGSCNDQTTHATDAVVATLANGSWSSPQNVTSCAATATSLSFENPKVAVDESGHGYVIGLATGTQSNLWYTDNTSGSWSSPQQVTHGASISEFAGSPAMRGLHAIAASRGAVYIAYAQDRGSNGDDIRLLSRSGGTWSGPVAVSPADPEGCHKFAVSVIARAGRVGVSYIRSFGGACHVVGTTNDFNTPQLRTGTPSHLTPITLDLPKNASCGDTSLSSDGDLFRVALSCGLGSQQLAGKLFYKREFLDVVGPKSHLLARKTRSGIQLTWRAQDPTPGAGVAGFQLQVRASGGQWRALPAPAHSRSLLYHASSGRHFVFRVRARDRVNNWGPWITAAAST
ncbi:MAG TPA: hypothetical protein VFA78_09330 [Chloroflexota bacterium]|nr:hypothetical protein [Chloroflexota bacterium]